MPADQNVQNHFPNCQKSQLIINSRGRPLGVCPLHYTTIFISSTEVKAAAEEVGACELSVGSSETYSTPGIDRHFLKTYCTMAGTGELANLRRLFNCIVAYVTDLCEYCEKEKNLMNKNIYNQVCTCLR